MHTIPRITKKRRDDLYTEHKRQGSDPLAQTARGKLQNRRSKLNDQINRELRLRAGAENLYKATTNKKLKQTVALELSFVNSNLQLLKEELADLNSSVAVYQNNGATQSIPMIPLGLKETKDVDFKTPFEEYTLAHYHESAKSYSEEISCISELRQACRTPSRTEEGLELLFNYYNQLYFVDKRFFPPDKCPGVYFEWYDSLTGVPTSQKTVGFEKGSILFNVGALYTQLAARQDRCHKEGINAAIVYFARAAGAFLYLEENFTNAPSMDMQGPSLAMLRQLMLAQAQECVYERKVLGGVQPGILCHVAAAHEASLASALYGDTHNAMGKSLVSDYIPPSWVSMVRVKHHYLKALAHYHLALAVLDYTDHESVAQLAEVFDQIHFRRSSTADRRYSSVTEVPPATEQERQDLAKGHLRECILCIEEAMRVHSVSRQLRKIDTFQDILKHSHDRALSKFSELEEEDDFGDLPLVPEIQAKSDEKVHSVIPDFLRYKVDDIFHRMGPLTIFSARHDWSAPHSVILSRQPGQEFGFSVRGNSPVIIAEVDKGSLAQKCGMQVGDFIIAVDQTDTKWSRHEEVVTMIRNTGSTIALKLITPKDRNYLEPKHDLATEQKSPYLMDPNSCDPEAVASINGGSPKSILKVGGVKSKHKPKSPWILRRKRSQSVEKEKKRKGSQPDVRDR